MDENSLRNTYTFKIKLGITDLMGVTNEYGEFVGCSLIKDFDKYIANHEYYDNLIKQKNEEYIKLLLKRNEYGKEVECDLSLIHNPLFDGPSEPKPIEEFHPLESYRMIFLDSVENSVNKLMHKTFKQNNMTTEEQIKHVKELRVDIDKNIQDVKEFQDVKIIKGHREIALVITKLQEAKMWLGQVLAEIGATTPYPHADNPANSIVSPTADTYNANILSNAAIVGEKPKYSFVSIHFTIKEQSFESLQKLLHKLVTTWMPTFVFSNNEIGTVAAHCFLPKETVIEKGYSMDLYDRLLDPFFPKQLSCLFVGDLENSRRRMLEQVKAENGYAIFIGDIKEGVKEEYDLAKELGVQILHLPHIAESK